MTFNDVLSKELTNSFSKYMNEYESLYLSLAETVYQFLKKREDSIILDLGSGPGILTEILDKKFPTSTVIGIEPSIEMIQSIKGEDFQKSRYIRGVSQYIPLKSNRIDFIVSRYSIPYWDRVDSAVDEIYRILKPGGRIIFESLNKSLPLWKLKTIQLSMKIKKAPSNVIDYHIDAYKSCFTIKELKDLLKSHGFNIIHKEYKKNDWRFLIIAEKPQD